MGQADLPNHDGKVASDKNMISNSYQMYKGGNINCCSYFLVIFETRSNFLIVFVRLILGKAGVEGFTRPQWEIGMISEFGFEVL